MCRPDHQRRWSGLWALLCCLIALGGCGGSVEPNQPGSATAATADDTHRAWVTAVREGNTDAALALVDPTMAERDTFARDAVARMQDYLTNAASPTGALQDVAIEPVSNGEGRSVWQFAQKRWCYRAELVSRDSSWYVSRWGQTSTNCS